MLSQLLKFTYCIFLFGKIILLACISFMVLIARAEKIQVVTEYLAPYQMKNKAGELTGASTEIVKALFEITKDKYDIQVLPWARAYITALNTPNTLIYSISRTPHREKLFVWLGTIRTDKIQLWGLRERFSAPVSHLDELKDYAIASVRKSYAEDYLSTSVFNNIYAVVDFDQSIKMLYRGRIDLILGDEVTLKPRIKQLNLDENKVISLAEIKEISADLHLAFNSKSDKKLIKRYRKAYQELIKSGKLAEIKHKWQLD
jgi:polar amino acid transport system substrate-binding protein